MNIDDAVTALDAAPAPAQPEKKAAQPEKEQDTAPAAEDGAETPADEAPEPEDDATPPVADDGGEDADPDGESEPGDADAEPEETAEAEPLEAPKWWDAEDKAEFATYPPEVQAKVLKQEEKRESVLQKSKAKADEATKAAQAELDAFKPITERLAQWLPKAMEAFKGHWGTADDFPFADYQKAYGTDEALRLQELFKTQKRQLDEARLASSQAEAREKQAAAKRELASLAEKAPELVDPKEGQARQEKLKAYAKAQGVNPDEIATAAQALLIWKAMKYDDAQAAASRQKAPKPARPTPKPSAAQGQSSSQRSAAAKLGKIRDVDDAVSYLNSLET